MTVQLDEYIIIQDHHVGISGHVCCMGMRQLSGEFSSIDDARRRGTSWIDAGACAAALDARLCGVRADDATDPRADPMPGSVARRWPVRYVQGDRGSEGSQGGRVEGAAGNGGTQAQS